MNYTETTLRREATNLELEKARILNLNGLDINEENTNAVNKLNEMLSDLYSGINSIEQIEIISKLTSN